MSFATLIAAVVLAWPPPPAVPLTVFDVIKMTQDKVADATILKEIQATKTSLRLSAQDAQILQFSGVSPRIIAALTPTDSKRVEAPPGIAFTSFGEPVAPAPRPVPAPKLAGTWVRDFSGFRIKMTFTANRMIGSMTGTDPDSGKSVTGSLDADYTLSSEGVVYGYVTGVDVNDPEAAGELQKMAGEPFAFRVRIDEKALSIREVKCGGHEMAEAGVALAGRYTLDDGTIPPLAKPKKAKKGAVTAAPPPGPQLLQQRYTVDPITGFEHRGVDFGMPSPANGPVGGNWPPIGGPPVMTQPQLVQQSGFVATLPMAPAPRPAGSPIGTWIRTVGPMQITMKINSDSIVITTRMATDIGTGVFTQSMMFTAETAMAKDGTTLFGVVTGADMSAEGTMPPGFNPLEGLECLKKLQDQAGEPLVMSVRIYDGELMVSRVKFGTAGEKSMKAGAEAGFALIGGKYQSLGNKPIPKPIPMTPIQFGPVPTAPGNAPMIVIEERSGCGSDKPSELTPVPVQGLPSLPSATGVLVAPQPERQLVPPPATSQPGREHFNSPPPGWVPPVTNPAPVPIPRAPLGLSREYYDPGTGTINRTTQLPPIAPPPMPSAPDEPKSRMERITDAVSTVAEGALKLASHLLPFQTYQGGMTLPGPQYLQQYPQYFPPDASFPLQREPVLQIQSLEMAPAPRAR